MSRGRDADRLERIARDLGPRVARYLLRRTTDPEDAADIFQATMVVAWRRIRDVPDDDDRALAWLFATARRCLANQRRAVRRRSAATERLAAEIRVTSAETEPPDAGVADAVAALPADQREVIELVYQDGLSCDRAAEVLGIGAAACRKRLQRARDALRIELLADDPELAESAPTSTDSGR